MSELRETGILPLVTIVVGIAVPLIFWGRGLIRGATADLVAGAAMLAVICVGSVLINPGVINIMGFWLAVFGLATLILSRFASPKCPISRTNLEALGASAVVAGFVFATLIC